MRTSLFSLPVTGCFWFLLLKFETGGPIPRAAGIRTRIQRLQNPFADVPRFLNLFISSKIAPIHLTFYPCSPRHTGIFPTSIAKDLRVLS